MILQTMVPNLRISPDLAGTNSTSRSGMGTMPAIVSVWTRLEVGFEEVSVGGWYWGDLECLIKLALFLQERLGGRLYRRER